MWKCSKIKPGQRSEAKIAINLDQLGRGKTKMSVNDRTWRRGKGVKKAAAPVIIGRDRLRCMQPGRRNVVGQHGTAQAALQMLLPADRFVHTEEELVGRQRDIDFVVAIVPVVAVGGWSVIGRSPQADVVAEELALS